MKLRPRDFLDFSVVLLGLLLSSLVISCLDVFETRTTSSHTVSIAPWNAEPPPQSSLEREYLVYRNSMRRWVFGYFPALSLVGGVLAGLACSGWRRAWLVGILAMAAVPLTAVGLLLLYPGAAAVCSLGYVAIAGASATTSGWLLRNGRGAWRRRATPDRCPDSGVIETIARED